MYKIIDLGFEFEPTGERLVGLIDPKMVKTASNDIQVFWDSVQRDPNSAYIWVIGVSAMEFYGCNNNGDSFYESDLKKYHDTFVSNANVFLHHVNKDPKKGIGKPIYSYYNDVMHRVELICEINKNSIGASDIVNKIKAGEPIFVSMGCNVQFDVCSICGNKAKTRAQYCTHLKYNMKKILPNGQQIYAINPTPKFFDISIVKKPADPTAFTLDKAASDASEYSEHPITSAELGEISEHNTQKLAALDKLSDLIKRVDALISDVKDDSGDTNVLRQVAKRGFGSMDYPALSHEELSANGVSPFGLAASLFGLGAPLTFNDSLYMAGKSTFGDEYSEKLVPSILAALPQAIEHLRESPVNLFELIQNALSGATSQPSREVVIRIIRPVAESRVALFSDMCGGMGKMASHVISGVTAPIVPNMDIKDIARFSAFVSQNVPGNLRPLTVTGHDGQRYNTTYGEVRNSSLLNTGPNGLSKVLGAALLVAALGSILQSPSDLKNLAIGVLSASAAVPLLSSDPKIKTDQGLSIPMNTLLTKSAMNTGPLQAKIKAVHPATYAGMSVPALLEMDYLYNKARYPGEDPKYYLSGVGRALNAAGRVVHENPLTAVAAGGVAGRLLAKKFNW